MLLEDQDIFTLFWAPDIGSGGQFLATTTSISPTLATSWTAPISLTVSSLGANSWWDFWPQPFTAGSQYLLYTSERNPSATARVDANIWLMYALHNVYLPLVQRD